MKASKGQMQSTVLLSHDAYELQQSAWQGNLRMQHWPEYLNGNHQLSHWTQESLNEKGLMPTFGNLTGYPDLVKL